GLSVLGGRSVSGGRSVLGRVGAAPGADELDHRGQHRENDDREDHVVELLLDDGHVPEGVAERQKADDPSERTCHVEDSEAAVAHASDASDEGSEGTNDGDEAGKNDRLTTVLLVEA